MGLAMGERTTTRVFEHLETDRLNLGHLKVILLSGMGFFTDAYDLFNIGVMLLILTPLWASRTYRRASWPQRPSGPP